jgi:hypothetical protein
MTAPPVSSFPKLNQLPDTFPTESAVRIEVEEGVPLFRASTSVTKRIEDLLDKENQGKLTRAEQDELDRYEEFDDYLSFLNRLVRNQLQPEPGQDG